MTLHEATNLSPRKRRERDAYFTPRCAAGALFAAEDAYLPLDVWEPACGDGAMSAPLAAFGCSVHSSDIEPKMSGAERKSFFDFTSETKPSVAIVTNPPFSFCTSTGKAKFLHHALDIGIEYMALLLPSTWPYAQRLGHLFERSAPAREHAMAWRIDWTGEGAAPGNHSWFVWDNRHGQRFHSGCWLRARVSKESALDAHPMSEDLAA